LRGPSEQSTESIRLGALALLREAVEGFSLHPFFSILDADANPPALPFAHQAELLLRVAFRRPVRILVGDEIGLGKTVEAILITKLLERRDGARRILVLVPRILLEQWRSELKRFGVSTSVLTRKDIPVLARHGFREGWYLASIDLVKRREHMRVVANADWDVVIVDEAHRVGRVGQGRAVTQRYELVEELAKVPSRSIILLSATPHRGHAADYISRLKLIDPYLEGEKELDDSNFYRLTRDVIVVRRTKLDVNEVYERREVFKRARFVARVVSATKEEGEFSEELLGFLRDKLLSYYNYIGEEPGPLPLLLAVVAKRASSSPYAAMKTLERMIWRRAAVVSGRAVAPAEAGALEETRSIVEAYLGLGFEDYGEAEELGDRYGAGEPDEVLNWFTEECSALLEERDVEALKRLLNLAKIIVERGDSRLKSVLALVRDHLERGDKVVIFTEFKDTAGYVHEKLKEAGFDAALVTSGGVVIPRWKEYKEPTIEDLKQHLERGYVKLVVSTDVASEGLNLQAANVIVNYEPTWSPIKLEQRLGRVWRLGQRREVTSYTLFLATRCDRDVLEVLYRKLLAWGRTLQESRVPIGEEVVIDMMSEEGATTVPLDAAKGTPRYSEYKALLTYLRGGREALKSYVDSIISALESLRRSLETVGLTRRLHVARIGKLLSEVLGDFSGDNADRVLRALFMATARLSGKAVEEKGGRVFVGTYRLDNMRDFYGATRSLLSSAGDAGRPIYLLSSAQVEGLKELHLFKVTLYFGRSPVYSETMGVGLGEGSAELRLLRGRKLLEVLVEALQLEKALLLTHEYSVAGELLQKMRTRSKEVLNLVVRSATDELLRYMKELEERGLSAPHKDWEPRDLGAFSDECRYLGAVIFASPPKPGVDVTPSPATVEEVEREAMRVAMEYERASGRVPDDVSRLEHYDIRSRDPRTGEVRFIEVKGKSGLGFEVELTETEFEVAREKGERYWLYIVYGIGTGSPRLLAIRDPVNNIVWREISTKKYRLQAGVAS